MAISKVNYGNKVLLDLTGDTIKKEKLLSGFTAHDASGEQITGTVTIQESKSVTITKSGTTVVTPDNGYESVKKVSVDVNVSGGFPNGTEWTQSNITSGNFDAVHNANGIWVACGSGYNGGLYYSTDGKTWIQSNMTTGSFYSVYNANGIWVTGGGGLYYSTDGKTWTQSNMTTVSFDSVYNANGIWVVASDNGGGLYYSTDGKTWTQSNMTTGSFDSVYNANGIWVSCIYSRDTNIIYYSTDGKVWTQSNITTRSLSSVYNANGIWVAAIKNNGLYYSVTWESS